MKKVLLLLLIFYSELFYSQEAIIYRNAGKKLTHSGQSYNVDLLILNHDNTYELILQKFESNRMRRKNIFYDIVIERGIWKKDNDTLLVIDNDGSKKRKFLKLNKDKIVPYKNELGASPSYWKKVQK